MTITTPPTRIEQTNQLLTEIRSASAKEFTGSIAATYQGNQVTVWLEDGALVAVHSPSYRAPLAELIQRQTGHSTVTDNPLSEAYQNEWMTADQVDAAVRDFAYGLLASALTWRRPKIRLARKVRVDREKFLPGQHAPWQRVVTDVTSRVDELVSSWAVITDRLTQEGMEPRPASQACGKLVVTVASHPLLNTGLPIDAAARVLGTTRQVLLREIARVILRGRDPLAFAVVTPVEAAPGDGVLVPEAIEAPDMQWASVEATAQVDVKAVQLGTADAPDPLDYLEQPRAVDDPFSEAAFDAAGAWPPVAALLAPGADSPWLPTCEGRDPELVATASQEIAQTNQPVPPLPVATAGPAPLLDEPAPEPAPAPDREPEPAPAGAWALPIADPLAAWVSQAGDEAERAVRSDVVALAAQAALGAAHERIGAVEQSFAAVREHGDALMDAVLAVPAAQSAMAEAEQSAHASQQAVEAARAAASAELAQVAAADERAAASAAAAERAAEAVETARLAYDQAVERARDATEMAAQDERHAAAAHRALDCGPGAVLADAQAAHQRVVDSELTPAREAFERAVQQRAAQEEAAADAQAALDGAGVAAQAAVRVLSSNWPTPPPGAQEAADRLEQVHAQVNAYYEHVNEVLVGHAAPDAGTDASDTQDDRLRALDEMMSKAAPMLLPTQADSPTETWRQADRAAAGGFYDLVSEPQVG